MSADGTYFCLLHTVFSENVETTRLYPGRIFSLIFYVISLYKPKLGSNVVTREGWARWTKHILNLNLGPTLTGTKYFGYCNSLSLLIFAVKVGLSGYPLQHCYTAHASTRSHQDSARFHPALRLQQRPLVSSLHLSSPKKYCAKYTFIDLYIFINIVMP